MLRAMLRSALLIVLLGCGAKTGLLVPEPPEDAGEDATDAGTDAPIDAPPDVPIDVGPDACEPFRSVARLASLDMFLLVDSSGSMESATASGATKMEAVAEAVTAFVESPGSTGIGVELTFFPFNEPDVPEACESDAQCGPEGSCLQPDICAPSYDTFCRTESDCVTAGTDEVCEPLGRCAGTTDLCLNPGTLCPGGTRCIPYGTCENRTSCRDGAYRRAEVPIALLPDNAPPIVRAMESRMPDGATPTLPALRGVLERARRWSRDSPGSKVVVLMATDGFPAACDPEITIFGETDPSAGIPAVVEVAEEGAADGLQTFVIGVFSPEEERDARSNLTRIAEAGDTDEALIVTTDEPVSDRLVEILMELRRSVRTCVYAIPSAGVLPDPSTLQVRILSPDGTARELTRVGDAGDCAAVPDGFFFPSEGGGGRPGFVELCPEPCDLATRPDHDIEMQAGCD